MRSSTTPEFWSAYRALSPTLRQAARKAYKLWQSDPRHPSLRFEPKGAYWSVRVTRSYRALAIQVPDGFVWFWIGNHDEYERLIRS